MGNHWIEQPLPAPEVERIGPFLLVHHWQRVLPGGQNQLEVGVGPHPNAASRRSRASMPVRSATGTAAATTTWCGQGARNGWTAARESCTASGPRYTLRRKAAGTSPACKASGTATLRPSLAHIECAGRSVRAVHGALAPWRGRSRVRARRPHRAQWAGCRGQGDAGPGRCIDR